MCSNEAHSEHIHISYETIEVPKIVISPSPANLL